MRNWLVFVMICVVLGLAAGCPQGQKTEEPAATSSSGAADTAGGSGIPDSTAGGGVAAEQPDSAATETAQATAGSNAETADASKLEGEWLALFGRHDNGVVEDAYTTGQRVKFDKQGQVVFTLIIAGKPTEMSGSYSAADGVAQLKLPAAEAVKSGFSKAAPLGISRNDEVGLLRQADRNEEIGLAKENAPDAQGNIMRNVKYAVYGDFLVMADSVDHLMVYGKYAEQEPAMPDLSGKWEAKLGAKTGIPATATWDGKLLAINMGADGAFTGKLVRGFAVGQLKGPQGLSLVGLVPAAADKLLGVYLPDPYLDLKADVEFTRSAK